MATIKIRMGAAYDDVTIMGSNDNGPRVLDRAAARAIPDRTKRGEAMRAITYAVVEETDVIKDRDKRRHRRALAEKHKRYKAA